MKSASSIVLAAFCGASLSLSAGPILFSITDLGTLGGANASANAINNQGQTAGSLTNISGNPQAFQSTTNITPAGASGASASSINNSGQVAGTTYVNGVAHATTWTNGAAQYLAPIGGTDAYGMGINDFGQVTGMSETSSGDGHAFLNTAGIMTDLGVLNGGTWSSGYGVNDSGQVVGYGDNSMGRFRGFVWSSSTGMVQLGTLGGGNSYAMAINGSGEITGTAQLSSGYMHAFSSNGSSLTDLGTLGGLSSNGYGINASGGIVGYSLTAGNSATHAFLDQNGVMYDLNTLLAGLTGWELTAAYGINDSGQIAGTGTFNGVEHAFLLDPVRSPLIEQFAPLQSQSVVPEPSSILLLATGAAALTIALRRKT
jgi:probable HAF family extracellular repeat protein